MSDRPDAQALHILLQQYPQLNVPHLSRRALLAASSLLAANLVACGGGGGGNSTTSSNTPAPTITALSPSNGDLPGGTVVMINGTNLTGATAVMFGSTAASSFTVVSSTQITATTPAHAMGSVTVSVTTPGGTATATTSFVYANGGVVTTLAGSGTGTFADGTGTAASFSFPQALAVDSSGNVYVADTNNELIRKITPMGVVSTWVGTAASFNAPSGIAVDSSGTVYVADYLNHMIRKITSSGVVSTLAGSTTPGSANGTGTAAAFNYPSSVAVDSSGCVYVADQNNNMIRKITTDGVVSTLAGSYNNGVGRSADGTGTAAGFNGPAGVAVDGSGNVYVADQQNNLIRMITPAGVVSTLAGSGAYTPFANGTGTAASFYYPSSVAVDSSGNVYVADYYDHMIRKIS